jgi:ribosomal-protein-alanine N-acetyltransferase
MRIPFLASGNRDVAIAPLKTSDSRAMADLHREDFARPWSDGEFARLLDQDAVFGCAAREIGNARSPILGFVVARLAAGEAEILSIAVARACRRRGLGRKLMEAVLRELHIQRAEALFLEVDETNFPAVALYRGLGFREVGRRPSYYQTPGKPKSDALVMRCNLR